MPAMQILTWNTQWCCGLDGHVSPQRIIEHARSLADFDVLCLQEIAQGYPRMPGSPGDQPAQIADLLGEGWRVFFGAAVQEFTPDGQPQQFGNLIATRLSVASVEHHRLPWPADAGVRSMPRMCTSVTVHMPLLGWVRVMTTHLEYYSAVQRTAQAHALHALHQQACQHAATPPQHDSSNSPFQSKPHTPHAILCGDFNAQAHEPEYPAIQASGLNPLQDAWPLAHGPQQPHAPTFRLFDRTYGPEPVACDFFFVSHSLAPHVRNVQVDGHTRASDHQPVILTLA